MRNLINRTLTLGFAPTCLAKRSRSVSPRVITVFIRRAERFIRVVLTAALDRKQRVPVSLPSIMGLNYATREFNARVYSRLMAIGSFEWMCRGKMIE